jgi:alpha-tubulin suppressor-like RCC1 family protein
MSSTKYTFAVRYANGTPSNTIIDLGDVLVEKVQFQTSNLWGWGSGANGSIGNSSAVSYSSPVQVGALSNWKMVSSGTSSSHAIKTDGTLWGWGSGASGSIGNGRAIKYSSPVQIGSLTNWKMVSSGTETVAAITYNGELYIWGNNAGYTINNTVTVNYSSPVQIGALTDWNIVAVNSGHVAAIKTDGTLWTWGSGSGNVYSNLIAYYSSPVQVGSLTNWTSVAVDVSGLITGAIESDGTLYMWGATTNCSLGNDTNISYSSPVQIGTLGNWKSVSIGSSHVAAIKTDGTMWTWGKNNFLQLGLNLSDATLQYSSPVQIGALTTWKQLRAGTNNSYAVKTDGSLWSWGRNNFGQIGNASATAYFSSPVQIGALNIWKSVSGDLTVHAIAVPQFGM